MDQINRVNVITDSINNVILNPIIQRQPYTLKQAKQVSCRIKAELEYLLHEMVIDNLLCRYNISAPRYTHITWAQLYPTTYKQCIGRILSIIVPMRIHSCWITKLFPFAFEFNIALGKYNVIKPYYHIDIDTEIHLLEPVEHVNITVKVDSN